MIYSHPSQYIYSIGVTDSSKISDDTIIGRYFSLTGFLETIGQSKLRLTKITEFIDQAEGIPLHNDYKVSIQNSEKYAGTDYKLKRLENCIKTTGNYYASCWIMKDIESFLMWKNYSSYNEGILLFTTVGGLLNSLDLVSYEDTNQVVGWFYGEVDYGYNKSLKSDHIRAFGKSVYFEDEKEFRIVRYNHPVLDDKYINAIINNFDFIDKVIVSPKASSEFMELIKKFMIDHGFEDSIVHSSETKNNRNEILYDSINGT